MLLYGQLDWYILASLCLCVTVWSVRLVYWQVCVCVLLHGHLHWYIGKSVCVTVWSFTLVYWQVCVCVLLHGHLHWYIGKSVCVTVWSFTLVYWQVCVCLCVTAWSFRLVYWQVCVCVLLYHGHLHWYIGKSVFVCVLLRGHLDWYIGKSVFVFVCYCSVTVWSFRLIYWQVFGLFLDPLSGTHCRCPSEKTQCFTTFKTKLKTHLFHIHLCWSASVSFCMYHSGGVCVCVCVIISLYGWGYFCVRWYGIWVLWVFFLCLVGCFSMVIWTSTVLSVLYACVLYLDLFSTIEHVSHGKAL